MFKIALFAGIFAVMFNSNLGQLGVNVGPCMTGGTCPSPYTCYQGTCYQGTLGQLGVNVGPCMTGGTCPSPYTCYQGTCYAQAESTCTDANASCATWVPNGFCKSTVYTTAQKKQYCAKSCKLC